MNSAPESLNSVDSGQRWPVLLGASVAMSISVVFMGRAFVNTGVKKWCRTFCCFREQGDPVTRDFVDKKMDEQRRANLMGVSTMIAFWGMLNCLLIVVHTSVGNPRWMTVGQDIVVCVVTLYAVGSHFWLKRLQTALVIQFTYVGLMLHLIGFVCLSSVSQIIFILVMIAAKFFQALLSMAVMSPALAAGVALLLCVLSNIAYMSTGVPCKEGFSMTQGTFASCEVVCDILILVVTMLWKRHSASRIASEIEMSISQGETRAARNLLNTVCDATVELDAGLNIVSDAPRFAILLQHGSGRSLQGAPILHFVIEEDREKFQEQLAKGPVVEDMANMFNVRVRDSISNAVNVEIFLVAVASPMTCTSYLIGVREFSDSEASFGSSLYGPMASWGSPQAQASVPEDAAVVAALPVRLAGSAPAGAGGAGGELAGDSEPVVSDRSAGASGSVASAEADADAVAVFFDVVSNAYEIERASGGFQIFLGPRKKDNCFMHWLQRSEVDSFVSWVQASCNDMRRLAQSGGGAIPEPAVFPQELRFRPGLLGDLGLGVACRAALDAPPGLSSATSVRLTLTDVQLVRWGAPAALAGRRAQRGGQRAERRRRPPGAGPAASAGSPVSAGTTPRATLRL